MKTLVIVLILTTLFSSCDKPSVETVGSVNEPSINNNIAVETPLRNVEISNSYEEEMPYQGVSIDEKFSFIERHDFQEEKLKDKNYSIKAEDLQISFYNFKPKEIKDNNGKRLFRFKTLFKDGYWANLVGISHLRGSKSKELYVIASGTGGVCCTNYWIMDLSKSKPRNIFRSEDYGYFRDAMEVFDAENDGILEIVQFDSHFRYFMDDCGSCSPEPRAVFKYDEISGEYLPVRNLQQDFIARAFLEERKWIKETSELLEKTQDPVKETEFRRRLVSHCVDTAYLGRKDEGIDIYKKYAVNKDIKVIKALKEGFKTSKYLQMQSK